MGFKPNTLYYADTYKPGHKPMLAPGTTRLYGTWIPRSIKHAPKGITKILCFGPQLTWKWLHDEFTENFFALPLDKAQQFGKDICMTIGQKYDSSHFDELHKLGYLPIRAKALPEGIETNPNIPHMTFVNTVNGYAWLTLYIETIVSALSWKSSTSATIALQYRRNCVEWVMKTDPTNAFLIDFLCHDFSARGLDPFSMLSSGLGHATSFRGSDTLICIPGARYFYNEPENEVCINSVIASEHSVSTTKIFTCGEKQMIIDWLKEFPTGILSIVADTFDLWKLIMEYLTDPEVKALIMARDGKLVIRPDSGDPVDIICGAFHTYSDHKEVDDKWFKLTSVQEGYTTPLKESEHKGVIELLWDIFGGTTNEEGYKVLDPHIGAIYGDSINLERQIQIYERLAAKGFASTNIVLGIGSFTYQFNTRDTFGFAAKGAWFEVKECQNCQDDKCYTRCQREEYKSYDIYKDPITDDGTKKSLKGLLQVYQDENGEYQVKEQCTPEEESKGILQVIYENGTFHNQITLTEIRNKLK